MRTARTIQGGDKVSGWGIAETAPEIEKIKAESADYLNGLNSCGEVSWEVYDYAFDFYVGLIQKAYELGKLEAKPHWIPCEERLPDKEDLYIVTIQCEHVDGWDDYVTGFAEWYVNDWHLVSCYPGQIKAVAWCELPEPYKGVTE